METNKYKFRGWNIYIADNDCCVAIYTFRLESGEIECEKYTLFLTV